MLHSVLDTAYGPLQVTVDERGFLVEILLPNRTLRTPENSTASDAAIDGMRAARLQWRIFRRKSRSFQLPVEPRGIAFERRVWERLREIPYGKTTSYGVLAAELGLMNGARAVGRANGSNPIPIVIPCHRVIGGNGALIGYGGGLELKRDLLESRSDGWLGSDVLMHRRWVDRRHYPSASTSTIDRGVRTSTSMPFGRGIRDVYPASDHPCSASSHKSHAAPSAGRTSHRADSRWNHGTCAFDRRRSGRHADARP